MTGLPLHRSDAALLVLLLAIAGAAGREQPAPRWAFVCPLCGKGSASPDDRRHGYCGACHEVTGVPEREPREGAA